MRARDWDYIERDNDYPTIIKLEESLPRARKQYTCCYCNQPILIGTRHYKQVYIEDGQFHSIRAHDAHAFCSVKDEVTE